MANFVYPSALGGFMAALFSWPVATIKMSLIRGYTPSTGHVFVSDLTGAGGVLVATHTLTGKTNVGGLVVAADFSWPAVPAGAACNMAAVYQASAPTGGADLAASAQRLIALFDTADNLPTTPIGADVNWDWTNVSNQVFQL